MSEIATCLCGTRDTGIDNDDGWAVTCNDCGCRGPFVPDAAAEADGRTTSDWLRNLANRASGLMPPAKGRGKPAKGPERKRQGRAKK